MLIYNLRRLIFFKFKNRLKLKNSIFYTFCFQKTTSTVSNQYCRTIKSRIIKCCSAMQLVMNCINICCRELDFLSSKFSDHTIVDIFTSPITLWTITMSMAYNKMINMINIIKYFLDAHHRTSISFPPRKAFFF